MIPHLHLLELDKFCCLPDHLRDSLVLSHLPETSSVKVDNKCIYLFISMATDLICYLTILNFSFIKDIRRIDKDMRDQHETSTRCDEVSLSYQI